MKELVFDFRKGQVWQTLVRLLISSFKRYSSVISIFSGCGTSDPLAGGLSGMPPYGSVGAKKCEKKSKSSSHYLHCSFSGNIDIRTESTFK